MNKNRFWFFVRRTLNLCCQRMLSKRWLKVVVDVFRWTLNHDCQRMWPKKRPGKLSMRRRNAAGFIMKIYNFWMILFQIYKYLAIPRSLPPKLIVNFVFMFKIWMLETLIWNIFIIPWSGQVMINMKTTYSGQRWEYSYEISKSLMYKNFKL